MRGARDSQFHKAFNAPIAKEHDTTRSAMLELAEPLIFRQLKTDKRIIDDLPDKIEQKMYCTLTQEQASLYEAIVKDVERQMKKSMACSTKARPCSCASCPPTTPPST